MILTGRRSTLFDSFLCAGLGAAGIVLVEVSRNASLKVLCFFTGRTWVAPWVVLGSTGRSLFFGDFDTKGVAFVVVSCKGCPVVFGFFIGRVWEAS